MSCAPAFFRRSPVVALGAMLALGGCAFSTRNATLIYPPTTDPSLVAQAHATEPPAPKDITIVLAPFEDKRADTTNVGTVRNTFGMKTAPVKAANSVTTWVNHALKVELSNAGYAVIPESEATDSSVLLKGSVDTVYADAYFEYGGKVSLEVNLSRGGRELLSRTYLGNGSAGANWSATAKSYSQSLALALADALKQMVVDVDKALQPE